MDHYQSLAHGVTPEYEEEAAAAAEHKIGSAAVVVLIIVSIILDILSIFEVPIADIIAWIIEVPMLLYFYYTGASQLRQIAANILAWLAELIPIIDFLPLYTIGIIIVVVLDRNETLARIASKIPQTSVKGKLSSGGGAAGSRLSKNTMYGAASGKRIAEADGVRKHFESLQKRMPGPLRSIPAGKGLEAESLPVARQSALSRVSSTVTNRIYQPQRTGSPSEMPVGSGDLPFPGTYENIEREILPTLSDITSDIDVTGEKTAAAAAAELASGRDSTQ